MNYLRFGIHSGPTKQCIYGDVNDENDESNETNETDDQSPELPELSESFDEGSIKTNLTGKERNFLSPDVHTTFCVEVHQGKRLYMWDRQKTITLLIIRA